MIRAAICHRLQPPYAQPLGTDHIYLLLTAAAGDLAEVRCYFADRYDPGPEAWLPLERVASDGVTDFWAVALPAFTRRVRYCFYLRDATGSQAWLTERGWADRRPRAGFFQYPYNHPADLPNLPRWVLGTTFYQIFPDRFANGNPDNDPPGTLPWGERPTGTSFFGGDLAGIRQRLDYLADLGAGCIYTTPLFASPSNHKYDTADYYRVDPHFGTNDELRELVAAAHARGIRVMLDAVFNHSGAGWFAFRDVCERGAASPYRDWFFRIDGFPVDEAAVNYETFATGIASMPKLNTAHPECAAYLLQVAEFWTRFAGVDGWRLDVANEVDHGFWRAFRQRVRAVNPEAFILGEVWHDAIRWLYGDQFDSVMHYPWREAVLAYLRGEVAPSAFAGWTARLRHQYLLMVAPGLLHLLGSHDTPRIRTELGGSADRAIQAAVLLLTASGVPMVYYGDEVGMEGGPDPDCRRCMVWDPDPTGRRIRHVYRTLMHLRRRLPWLSWGGFADLVVDDASEVYAYRRHAGGPLARVYGGAEGAGAAGAAAGGPAGAEGAGAAGTEARGPGGTADAGAAQVLVALNTGRGPAQVALPVGPRVGALVEVLSGTGVPVEGGTVRITLPPNGAAVLVPAGEVAP